MNEAQTDINAVLTLYLALQEQERTLREEKGRLQEQIAAHMQAANQTVWLPNVDGQRLKVRCHRSTTVEYDEPILKERLGERYNLILAPDLRKIRQNMETVAETLEPIMALVGSPSPDRVRSAIEKGLVTAGEFAGAFSKTTRDLVSVARAREDGDNRIEEHSPFARTI